MVDFLSTVVVFSGFLISVITVGTETPFSRISLMAIGSRIFIPNIPANLASLYDRFSTSVNPSLIILGSAETTELSFSKSIFTLNFLCNKIPKSAAVLSEPPLSYVVIIPSLVRPIKPPIVTTWFSLINLSRNSTFLLDSDTRKFVDSMLRSVIIGQLSRPTTFDFIP